MSELTQTNIDHRLFHEKLLTTVCGLALLTSIGVAREAKAEDSERPTVWIELGGQLERMNNGEETFAPPFLGSFDHLGFISVQSLQRPPQYSNGAEGNISFTPRGSEWVFSAAVRYGRANGQRQFNQQLPKIPSIKAKTLAGKIIYITQVEPYHLNTATQHADNHLILDFQVGKDVGLGLFSDDSNSNLSLGVRFAQFSSARTAGMNGVPDFRVVGTDLKYGILQTKHRYSGLLEAETSFHGVGPSLSWNGSVPLGADDDDRQITVDWGVNAAALFGRQKAHGDANVTGTHYSHYQRLVPLVIRTNDPVYHHPVIIRRSNSVTVPNLGGFAGVSFRYSDLKVSMGYRADVYFGAMDGGIEMRETENRSFYGPFATFSIGLGG